MKPRSESATALPATPRMTQLVIAVSVAAILIFGVFLDPVVSWTRRGGDLIQAAPGAPAPGAGQATAALR